MTCGSQTRMVATPAATDTTQGAVLIGGTDPTAAVSVHRLRIKDLLDRVGDTFTDSAESPTINSGAANAGSQITSPIFYALGNSAGDPISTTSVTLDNLADWSFRFTTGGIGFYWPGPLESGASSKPTTYVGLLHDGTTLEINGRVNDSYDIFVDGKFVAKHDSGAGTGYSPVNTLITFATRARRKVEILGLWNGLGGFRCGPTETIEPVDVAGYTRINCMTDSYGGEDSTRFNLGITGEMAARLGTILTYTNAGGGSGYVAGGSLSLDFVARASLMARSTPDIIVTLGGINDSTGTLEAEATAYYAALRSENPRAVLVAGGCWAPNGTSTSSAAAKLALIRSGLVAAGGDWIMVNNVAGTWEASSGETGRVGNAPWITGAGTVAAPTGSGNADIYIQSDGIHPEGPAACEYLGALLASGIESGLRSIYAAL